MSSLGRLFSGIFKNAGDDVADKIASNYSDDVIKFMSKNSADDIADKYGNLIATHQLTPEKLRGAADLGGFVQPSMAVVDANKGTNFLPGSDFGDIVIVANRDMVDPANAASKTILGDRDIYSPRFPNTTYKMNDDALREFAAANNMSNASARSNLDLDELYSPAMRDAFQLQNPQFADAYTSEIRGNPEFNKFAQENLGKLRGDKIIKYTNKRGTEKELPLTAQNASDAMNELAAISGEQGWTPPNTQAYVDNTRKFNSLDDLYKNKYRLIDNRTGEATKELADNLFSDVLGRVKESDLPRFEGLDFGIDNSAAEYLNDALKSPSKLKAAKGELPKDVADDVTNLKKLYKEVPVSYFEAKPRRVVNDDEFHSAYIPEGSSQQVIDDLKKLGVNNINKYVDKGDLDLALSYLAKTGRRGKSPYVLGLGALAPTAGLVEYLGDPQQSSA